MVGRRGSKQFTLVCNVGPRHLRKAVPAMELARRPCSAFGKHDSAPRVLVTGGAGFVGSHLIPRLRQELPTASIKVVDNLWRGQLSNLLSEHGQQVVDFVEDLCVEDLTNPEVSLRLMTNVDLVYHLADVVAGIDFVFGHQPFVFRENILINSNVLTAARQHGVRDFIYTGTACSFPKGMQSDYNLSRIPDDRAYPAEPESAYGWSKLMGEYELGLAQHPGEFNVGILRFHNLYGPRSNYGPNVSQVLPSLMRKAIAYPAEPFQVWGSGMQYRDFLYIDDAVEALLAMLRFGMNAGPVQVGTGEPVTIRTAAELVSALSEELMGKTLPLPVFDTSKPEGDRGRVADIARARTILRWSAKTDIADGLRTTFKWVLQDRRLRRRSSNFLVRPRVGHQAEQYAGLQAGRQAGLGAQGNLDPCLAGLTAEPAVAITSVPSSYFSATKMASTLWDPAYVTTSPGAIPLVLYHELSWDAKLNLTAMSMAQRVARMPAARCHVDLFKAEPWLLHVSAGPSMNKTLAQYFWMRREEAQKGRAQKEAPHRLVRKVAAMRNAVHQLPESAVIVWLDGDCVMLQQLDTRFLAFARQHDYASILRTTWNKTMVNRPSRFKPGVLSSLVWVPDTGITTLRVSWRSRALLDNAKSMYEWGVFAWLESCRRGVADFVKMSYQDPSRIVPEAPSDAADWICRGYFVGFSDIQVFWFLAVALQHPWLGTDQALHFLGSMPAALRIPGLRVGWYDLKCQFDRSEANEPWARIWRSYNQRPRTQQTLDYSNASWEMHLGPEWVCPGVRRTELSVAPFHLFRYVAHIKGSNGPLSNKQANALQLQLEKVASARAKVSGWSGRGRG